MAVRIDIPGIGEVEAQNAASEQTLREILRALGGRRTTLGPNQGQGQGIDPKTGKNVEDLGRASEYASGEVTTFAGRVKSAAAGLGNLITAVFTSTVGAASNLTEELINGGNTLSDFARHLPIPYLTKFTGLIDNQTELFRELSSSGATFGNNMFEVIRVAGNAAIPLQDFAQLVASNAEQLRLFGPSVASGAQQFATLSKQFRQGAAGQRLMQIGFTTQELNENLINFNEILFLSGRAQKMTSAELVAGTAEYSMELDKIAKLTGKSRKALEDESKQRNRDLRVQLAISQLGPKFELALKQASAGSERFQAALVDVSDGLAQDPLTRILSVQSEAFKRDAQNIQNMDADTRNNFFKAVEQDIRKVFADMPRSQVDALIRQGGPMGELAGLAGEMAHLRMTTEGAASQVDKEQAARDKATESFTTLAETINDLRGTIQVELIDSKIFQDFKNGLASIIPDLDESRDLYKKIKEVLQPYLDGLSDLWEWTKTDGYNMMVDGMSKAWNWMKTDGLKMIQDGFNTAMGWWNSIDYQAIKNSFLAGWKTIKDFWDNLPSLDDIEKKFDEMLQKLKDMIPEIPTIEDIRKEINEGIERLKDAIPTVEDMKQALIDLKDYFIKQLKAVLDFLLPDLPSLEDAKNALDKAQTKVSEFAESTKETAKEGINAIGEFANKGLNFGKSIINDPLQFFRSKDDSEVEPNVKKDTKEKMVFDNESKTTMGGNDITGSINNSMLEALREQTRVLKKLQKQSSNNLVQ